MNNEEYEKMVAEDRQKEILKKDKDLNINQLSAKITSISKHYQELLKVWNKKPGPTAEVKKELMAINAAIAEFFIITG